VKIDGSGRMIRILSRNTCRVNCNISMVSKRIINYAAICGAVSIMMAITIRVAK